jgi:hemolysin activation/secretion protein
MTFSFLRCPAGLLCLAILCAGLGGTPTHAQGLAPSDAARDLAAIAAQATAPDPTPAPAPITSRPAAAPTMTLRAIRLAAPSAYLGQDQIDAALAPFIGRTIALADLSQITAAIDALYRAQDIGLAQASIAAIDTPTGTMTLRLIEARLGDVRYDAGRIAPQYLRFRLGFAEGQLADTRHIKGRLIGLSLTDGMQANAAFSPGALPGTTDLTIALADQPAFSGSVGLDNYGAPADGTERLRFALRANNVSGWNDPLSLDLTHSAGKHSATLAYARVVTPAGGRVGLSLTTLSATAEIGPARRTDGRSLLLSYSQPLRMTETSQILFTGAAEVFDETARLGAVPLADQTGRSLSIGVTGQHSHASGTPGRIAWAVSLTAGRFDDAITGSEAQGDRRLNGALNYQRQITGVGYLSFSGAVQIPLSNRTPSRAAMTITSVGAVPGYTEGLSAGAAGYWMRLQLERGQRLGGLTDTIDARPYAFVAVGEAFDRNASQWQGQGQAASVGIGVSALIDQRFAFDLQLASPQSALLSEGTNRKPTLRAAISFTF